ncbi:MAG: chemotaxis protein CheA [Thermotaleaceae bacterium]
MYDGNNHEPMVDMFIFETTQLIQQLEALILENEKANDYSVEAIHEIFRIMHTIKGSSAMMLYNNIATLAHSMEDLFYYIREQKPEHIDYGFLSNLVLEGVDFTKVEIEKIKNKDAIDGDFSELIENIDLFLHTLKADGQGDDSVKEESSLVTKQQYYMTHEQTFVPGYDKYYKAILFYELDCGMENLRAYTVVHHLKDFPAEFYYYPMDIVDNNDSAQIIKEQGFTILLKTDKSYQMVWDYFMQTAFLKDLELVELDNNEAFNELIKTKKPTAVENVIEGPVYIHKQDKEQVHKRSEESNSTQQSIISVSVAKLDKLMDLVGEMVIAEAMVTQNPDLQGLELDNFYKAARQLHKITSEVQDMVMAIRMVPLANTFHKMHRIVRDMSKRLGKAVELKIIGEETEVDKNIIEHIADPLMHLVRNAIDHGIEGEEDRIANGKPKTGTITLEAKNAGGDVLIIIKDDGKGLSKTKILQKAQKNGLLYKTEKEMSDKEIYQLIFLPGFSTKEGITEFSGRGVGMDVVIKNIESVGGSVAVDSTEGMGSTITLKIPLTLAIIDGMNIKVGKARYTLPTTAIKESFRPRDKDIIRDPENNEMIMVRGQCYPILRLHEHFGVKTNTIELAEGILIMVEQEEKSFCLFADELLGQQQVVVKALPKYIIHMKKIAGLAGCTLLGDGSISLILDIGGLFPKADNQWVE